MFDWLIKAALVIILSDMAIEVISRRLRQRSFHNPKKESCPVVDIRVAAVRAARVREAKLQAEARDMHREIAAYLGGDSHEA